MKEIIAAILYCNLVTNTEGKYSLKFAPGRLVAGVVRSAIAATFGYIYLHG